MKRWKILILDPEPFVQDLLRIKLEAKGAEVFIAEKKQDAKRALSTISPDLIILEILHPNLDAYRFIQWIKNHPRLAKIKVVIVSFKRKDPETAFLYNVWIEDYFNKPFVPDRVAEQILKILS